MAWAERVVADETRETSDESSDFLDGFAAGAGALTHSRCGSFLAPMTSSKFSFRSPMYLMSARFTDGYEDRRNAK